MSRAVSARGRRANTGDGALAGMCPGGSADGEGRNRHRRGRHRRADCPGLTVQGLTVQGWTVQGLTVQADRAGPTDSAGPDGAGLTEKGTRPRSGRVMWALDSRLRAWLLCRTVAMRTAEEIIVVAVRIATVLHTPAAGARALEGCRRSTRRCDGALARVAEEARPRGRRRSRRSCLRGRVTWLGD